MERIHVKKFLKGDYSLKEVADYIRGNVRYYCYHKDHLRWLIALHIREQLVFRIDVMMNRECYLRGSCIKCGCSTTALQMTNATCKGNCYPSMMSRSQWKQFKRGGEVFTCKGVWRNKIVVNQFKYNSQKRFITYVGQD